MKQFNLLVKIEYPDLIKSLFLILTILFVFINQISSAQNLTSATVSGSANTSSSTYTDVTGSVVSVSANAGSKVLVVATFTGRTTTIGSAEASYRLVDDEGRVSGELKRVHNGYYGIGSVAFIFDVSISGTQNYKLQHNTTALTLQTDFSVTAVSLSDGSNHLNSDVKTLTSPLEITTTQESALESNLITTSAEGGFYVSASIQTAKTSGGSNTVVGEWVLQYKKTVSGTWNNLSYPVNRSTSGNGKGIVNLVGALPNTSTAGDYYFRVAHRKISGAEQIETQAGNLVVVALGTSDGFFPVMIASKPSAVTTLTTYTNVITNKIIPQSDTDFFLHSQFNMRANNTANAPRYDLYAQGPSVNYDGRDHLRYLSGSTDRGSGACAGLITGMISGSTYDVSLRHASVSPRTLTTENSYLVGFGLYKSSLPLVSPITVNATQGVMSSSYNTLKEAFDAINAGTFKGDVTILVNANTTETASSVLNASESGSANYNSVNIYPTADGITISGNIAAPLINLNGADNVTIDGRVNATGSTKSLTIANTSTNGGAAVCAIQFILSAASNTVKYCNIKASPTNSAGSIILFSTATTGNGNDNNIIDNNNITSGSGGRVVNAIYSVGTSGRENNGIVISNNDIYDVWRTGSNSNSIHLAGNTTNCTVSGNSFYETTSFAPAGAFTYRAISLNNNTSGNTFTITDNFIGGSAAQCGGTAFTVSAANSHQFQGIYLNVGTTTATSVQNNTIRNFSYSGTATSPWQGINVTAGLVNVGTVSGNTIGAGTGTGSILVSSQATTASTSVYGIYIAGTGTVNCNNNNVGSITTTNENSTFATHFYGIYKLNVAGTTTINNNTVGSEITDSSILTNSASTATDQLLYGIYSIGTGTTAITNNTVANIHNAGNYYSASSVATAGIATYGGVNTINRNTVHHISCSNYLTTGILQKSLVNNQVITNNTLYDLSNINTSAAVRVNGIAYDGPTTGTNSITGNFIYRLDNSSSNILSSINGINLNSGTVTCANNIISIGDEVSNAFQIYGIWDAGIAGQVNSIYFNTVYISGIPVGTTANTFAFYKSTNTGTTNLRNNILVNARSGGSTGKHYAIGLQGIANLTIDYNDYYAAGTGGLLGRLVASDKADLVAWQAGTTQDANSKNLDPGFIDSESHFAMDYYFSTATLPAIAIPAVLTDYSGVSRGSTPKMGALESNSFSWKGGISTDFGTAGNWLQNVVPPDGADITFDTNPDRSCFLDKNRVFGSIINAQETDKFNVNGKQLRLNRNLIFSNGAQLDATSVSSAVLFAGPDAQNIPEGSLVSNSVYELGIDNIYGLTLNDDMTVTQALNLTNGEFTIGANTLTLNGVINSISGSLTGGSNTNIIIDGGSTSSSTTLPSISVNNLTVNRTSGLRLGGNVNVSGTLTLTDGALITDDNTLTLSGNTPVRTNGSINAGAAGAALVFGNAVEFNLPASIFSAAVNNLTINGAGGITSNSDFTINGVLQLNNANPSDTKGLLDMFDGTAAKTLTMAANATTEGTGDVTGIVKRQHSFITGENYSFGSQFTTLTFLGSGVKPTEVSCKIVIGTVPSWRATATRRYYSFSQVGGTDRVIVNLRYLDAELNESETDESKLVLWDAHGVPNNWIKIEPHGKTNNSITDNWVGLAGTSISYLASSKQWGFSYSTSVKNEWLGADEINPTKWDEINNWSGGNIPLPTDDVLIPAGKPAYPALTLDVAVNSLEIEADASVNAGSYNITINGNTGAWTNYGDFTPGTGTVIFAHTNNTRVVSITGTTNFYNVQIESTAWLTPSTSSILRIAGAINILSGGKFDCTNTNNTIEYNGTNQTVVNPNGALGGYHNLILSGSGTKILPATALSIIDIFSMSGAASATAASDLTIGGDFSITESAAFTTGNYNHSIGGDLDNSGTINITTGNVITMYGIEAQSILGTNSIYFDNLVINNNAGISLFNNQTINNALTLSNGNLAFEGNLLTINGSINKAGGFLSVNPLSSLTFAGTAPLTFPDNLFDTPPTINNLTINRSGGVSLGNQDLTINGLLDLFSGTLTLGTNKLTLSGSPPAKTNGSIDAGNAGATLELSCSSAVVLPASLFTGSINNLTINVPAGVSTMSDLTVNGILNLQTANPSATSGSLNMWDGSAIKTLTLGPGSTCTGQGDVTGIITRNSITSGVTYCFGNPYTTAYFPPDGTLPSQISVKINIGTTPSWRSGAINREIEIIQTGANGTKAVFSCHYLDTELNGNNENNLVFWVGLSPTNFEYGRSNNNPADNWVVLSNVNMAFFSSTWDGLKRITLDEASTTSTLVWNGSLSDSWTSVENWTPNIGPSFDKNIIIPDASTTTNSPTLPVISEVKTLTLNAGAVLNSTPAAQLTLNGTSAWNNQGGTFNAGTSNIIFTNSEATIAGTTNFYNLTTTTSKFVTLVSGSITRIAGAINNNGAIRTSQGGPTTVEYNGAGPQTVVVPNSATNSYSTLILSGSGTKTMPATGLSIDDDFIMSGTAVANAGADISFKGDFTIGAGATFNTGAFNHSIAGTFENQGTFLASAGNTVTMNGVSEQLIQGSSVTTFDNLNINNNIGVKLLVNSIVNNTFTLTNGLFSLGSNNLILASGNAVGGNSFSSSKMIVADGSGVVRRNYSGAGSYLFPIGSVTNTIGYTPVTLNITAGTFANAYVDVNLKDLIHPDEPDDANYIKRYWTITSSGITSPVYNVDFTYVDGDIQGDEEKFEAAKYNGSLPWEYPATGSVNAGTNTISFTGLTTFGDFKAAGKLSVSAAANPTSVCSGTSATLTATVAGGCAPYTFSWLPGGETGSSISVLPSVTTTYTVTVTDNIGTKLTSNVTLTVYEPSTIALASGTQSPVVCLGTAITSTVYTFGGSATNATVANLPDGLSSVVNTSAKTVTVSGYPVTGGTYTITTTGHNEPCIAATISGTVTVNPLPTASISGTSSPICAGDDAVFTLTGTSGATVTYNINNGSNATVTLTGGTTTVTVSAASASQTLTLVSVADGTCSQSLTEIAMVVVNPLPATGEIIPD